MKNFKSQIFSLILGTLTFGQFSIGASSHHHFSVTDYDIQNAKCTSKKAPTLEELRKWYYEELPLMSEEGDERVNKRRFKVEFKDELYAGIGLLFYILPSSMEIALKDKFRRYPTPSDCHKVSCVLQHYFDSESYGLKLMYILKMFGYNASYYSHYEVNQKLPFTEDELDSIIRALSDFPRMPVHKPSHNIPFYRIPMYNGRTYAQTTPTWTAFYDKWAMASPLGQIATVNHELGHNFTWLNLGLRVIERWGKLLEAEPYRISGYAMTNFQESIAESVSAYRYDAKRFKDNAPLRYEFIKNIVYDGVEFIEESDCKNARSYRDKVATAILARLKELKVDFSPNDLEKFNMNKTCGWHVMRDFYGDTYYGDAREIPKFCIVKALALSQFDLVFDDESELPPSNEYHDLVEHILLLVSFPLEENMDDILLKLRSLVFDNVRDSLTSVIYENKCRNHISKSKLNPFLEDFFWDDRPYEVIDYKFRQNVSTVSSTLTYWINGNAITVQHNPILKAVKFFKERISNSLKAFLPALDTYIHTNQLECSSESIRAGYKELHVLPDLGE